MMTGAASMPGIIQSLAVQLAAFVAILLFASGLHKLMRRNRIVAAVRDFAGVPQSLAPLAAATAAVAEILGGGLLLSPSHRAAGGALAALIFGGYLLLILRAVAQGKRDVDCGCTWGAAQRPLGAYHAARNVILIGAALLTTAGSAAPIGAPPITALQIVAATALVALYGALDEVMGLVPPRAGALS